MSRINYVLSSVEHKKKFYNLEASFLQEPNILEGPEYEKKINIIFTYIEKF